jgi:hypothetical protein
LRWFIKLCKPNVRVVLKADHSGRAV